MSANAARPPASKGRSSGRGIGVDAAGNPAVDPTENVKALSDAANQRQDDLRNTESKYQDGMRSASERFQDFARDMESKMATLLSAAESRRVDQLASLRQTYETRIADMLRTSVESTSTLVSTQLVSIQNTFNDRVAKLEQFRYESSGRTSVADPALADAMAKMAASIGSLTATNAEALTKMAAAHLTSMNEMAASIGNLQTTGAKVAGRDQGMATVWAWIAAAIGAAVGISGLIGFVIELAHRTP